ncbi:MAG: alpha/beta hydrolase [Dehalococcoidales bacterium]|nr:MAG: alpha/beta hydrolase [Dehalococcoidales bacterium]
MVLTVLSPDKEYLDIHNDVKLQKKTMGELQVFLISYTFTDEFIKQNPGFLTPRQPIDENLRSSFIKHWDALLQHDTYQQLSDIKAPTLVIHGEADKVFNLENAKIMASRIPNAELVTFPNTGHALIEAGVKVHEVILNFLKRNNKK